MIVNLILLAVLAVVAFALWRQGAWATMLMLLNILAAATLATAWYETLVVMIEPVVPTYTYLLDFLCVWGVFSLSLLLLRSRAPRRRPPRQQPRPPPPSIPRPPGS